MRLDGKTVVVTGAGRGIGAAICETVCELGGHAVVADFSGDQEATAKRLTEAGHSAEAAHMDVTDSKSVDAVLDDVKSRRGSVDGLVANAATNNEYGLADHTDEEWRRVMSVNLDGVFYCVRSAGNHMIEQGGGSIVCISSICAVKAVRPEVHPAYDISKAAVGNLCRVVGVEWAKKGVRLNALGPGYTETDMLRALGLERPDVMQQWIDDIPMGRLIQPREIANVVSFLLSDASSAITAQLLFADAGYTSA